MKKLQMTVCGVLFALMGSAHARDIKGEMVRMAGLSLAQGYCNAAFQRAGQVTTGGPANTRYAASNPVLHHCQYVRETLDDNACLASKKCRSYENWSAANPRFSPTAPRAVFLAELEKRQRLAYAQRVSAFTVPLALQRIAGHT